MTTASDAQLRARYFDGVSAQSRDVVLALRGGSC
jgi:hypothetical protein